MQIRYWAMLVLSIALVASVAVAGSPVSPYETTNPSQHEVLPDFSDKAFGDALDFKASAMAGANYVRYMQADFTEDNAGNGAVDDADPNDAGWNWVISDFSHNGAASSTNLYGVTALGMYHAYLLEPVNELFIAMRDAADHMVVTGPNGPLGDGAGGIRSASDVEFLMRFASLPVVTNPAYYHDGAKAIWDRHLTVYGSGTGLAEAIRDFRAPSYPNGLIAWDVGLWSVALMQIADVFPTDPIDYAADAIEIAEVLYQDSFVPGGYFQPFGHSQGSTDDYSNPDYESFTIGVVGLIQAFESTGVHPAELPALEALLLECQYPDGSFGNQYGASTTVNDRDFQSTAYGVIALVQNTAATPTNLDAIYRGASWLSAVQDVSGGWLYSSGDHYPEIGAECTAGLALAWNLVGCSIVPTAEAPDPVQCGQYKDITFAFDRTDGTPGLRGYEITFEITGPVSFAVGDINDDGALSAVGGSYYHVVDNEDGTYTANDAILGTTPGLLIDADLFTVTVMTTSDGPVEVNILSYKLRNPDNIEIFGDIFGTSFIVDCTAPDPVTNITATPGHKLVDVAWQHTEVDVAYYEVYRGLWYDTIIGDSAYPEYDDLTGEMIPTRPATYAIAAAAGGEWELAGTVLVGTTSFQDIWLGAPERGVYYYEVFAIDGAGNVSIPADDNDRATNYWLGDVEFEDGDVDAGDMTVLGATFGYGGTDGDYNNYADVGPTDDWSGVGIPETDSVIDFEDLMIFAMNYGNVSKQLFTNDGSTPDLAWKQVADREWVLELVSPCSNFKGLHLTSVLPAGTRCQVVGGELVSSQSTPVFLQNIDRRGLDANLAVMGSGVSFMGSGELFKVFVDSDVDLTKAEINVRGLNNGQLASETSNIVPRAFSVSPNFPNPFNPSTTIIFSLPTRQAVKLSIYSVDGRLVKTLVNESREAGNHEEVWLGRNDAGQPVASGTYFYRVDAGAYSQVRKMTLVK